MEGWVKKEVEFKMERGRLRINIARQALSGVTAGHDSSSRSFCICTKRCMAVNGYVILPTLRFPGMDVALNLGIYLHGHGWLHSHIVAPARP